MNDGPLVAWTLDRAHVAVPVDLTVYMIDAVIRAAYKLTDRCFTLVQRDEADQRCATVFLVGRNDTTDVRQLALELHNELVDQQLRCRLDEQFRDMRTLMVAQAFSEGNLLDPDADDGDYRADSHGAGTHR